MGSGPKQEMESLQKKYKEICENLNLDKSTSDEAFASFNRIRNNYSLEGEKLHWLACALYVTCRKGYTPTLNKGGYAENNCVSLTQLLKECNLSLVQFFIMMKKWADMANLSQEMRNKLDYFERNFNVTTIIFKKYRQIFLDIFKNLPSTQTKQTPKNKKQKGRLNLISSEVFNFCWTLFIHVKSNFSEITADLVNSYHLLIACIDFCFNNILFSENSKELLNPQFSELPENYLEEDFELPEDTICIISSLCEKFNAIQVDAKGIKEHWWKPYIKRLVEKKVLKYRNTDLLIGFLDLNNYDFNLKNISKEYDIYVHKIGDFDERIFLCDTYEEIGNPNLEFLTQQINEIKTHIEEKKNLAPTTPLSNRHLLNNRDYGDMTPVSNATQMVSRLQSIIINYTDQPSSSLMKIFEKCTPNPCSSIKQRITKLSEHFLDVYTDFSEDENGKKSKSSTQSTDFAKKRLRFAVTLYYKMLENIAKRESKMMEINKNSEALTCVLSNEIFHIALFACSVEIILFAYKSQRVFPWIIDILKNFNGVDFQPSDFYKVIELIIRDEEGFSRDVVKHLTLLEERVLESLVWRSDSNIWDKIKTYGNIPAFQDVSLFSSDIPSTPVSTSKSNKDSSLSERFGSPANANIRRRLFEASANNEANNKPQNANSSPQQIVQFALQTPETGNVRYIISYPQPVPSNTNEQNNTTNNTQTLPKQNKIGPLGLFFRKVYYLAWLRLKDLCEKLKISDTEILQKIWTCFETAVRFNSDLLKDRHLDQTIMCTIYSICKITKRNVTFHEIMAAYRFQPQSESHVYRSILLSKKKNVSSKEVKKTNSRLSSPSKENTSQQASLNKNETDFIEERGDIIMFYNQIFVTEMKKYIMKFSVDNSSPPLSPLPRKAPNLVSPFRKISLSHPVFVSPLKSEDIISSPKRHNMYSFSISPANDLKAINHMVKNGNSQNYSNLRNNFSGVLNNANNGRKVSKRMFQDSDSNEGSPVKKQCSDLNLLNSKIGNVFTNREESNDSYNGDSNLD